MEHLTETETETEIETRHVKDVYTEIADAFDKTRYSVWNFVHQFLKDKQHLYGLDIGCGNGKNLVYPENMVGVDNCLRFLQIIKEKSPLAKVIHSNCLNMPFADESFDYAMGISIFHHLSDENRRTNAIVEMIRVMRKGGEGIFNLWSYENQERRKFQSHGDNFVPWTSKTNNDLVHQRYYHIYDYTGVLRLVANVSHRAPIDTIRIVNERGNWIVRFRKSVNSTRKRPREEMEFE